MYYLVYKITNLINGKYYIGKHCTDKLDDSYMGSGKLIKDAIKKYGKINFKKEILVSCDNEFDMNVIESCLINPFPNNKLSYNLTEGGNGSFKYINQNGLSRTEECKIKMKTSLKNYWNKPESREKKSKEKKDYFAMYGSAHISVGLKKRYENKDFHEKFKTKMSEVNSRLDKRLDAGAKIKDKWKNDPVFRDKMRNRKSRGSDNSKLKEYWKNPDFRNKMLSARKEKREKKLQAKNNSKID